MSDPLTKEQQVAKLTEEVEALFDNEKGREEEASPLGMLTPLSLWEFVSIFTPSSTGQLTAPSDEDVDAERLRDDSVMAQGLYQDFIQESSGIQQALHNVCIVAFSEERNKDARSTIALYDDFKDMSQGDGVAAIAMALQSTFTYPSGDDGYCARFSLLEGLNFMQLTYAQRRRDLPLQFSLLREQLVIPLPNLHRAGADCVNSLRRIGHLLLTFIAG